ncbi:GNAT family N-acetyltransferase [Lacticaseibacillus baoqingensis]|uniref:GNAT family N-acetyltransferase n=1 Tax=Lacticaseibacillus baoqingensis TaxID=2486013 RepID=A0ABW4E385_9LACO|nr:GNAT family N-acetyltransferase [Lacticaseibacillus baoqingensis]
MAKIRNAQAADVSALLLLVQGYYADSPVAHTVDKAALLAHITQLIRPDDPLGGLLVATDADGQLLGFAFLYFGFDKRALKRTVILNDLYVAPKARRQGIAKQLLQATFAWAKARQAISVTWQTRTSNHHAQRLYDTVGEREQGWIHYAHALR